jgi:hypothetical protein
MRLYSKGLRGIGSEGFAVDLLALFLHLLVHLLAVLLLLGLGLVDGLLLIDCLILRIGNRFGGVEVASSDVEDEIGALPREKNVVLGGASDMRVRYVVPLNRNH